MFSTPLVKLVLSLFLLWLWSSSSMVGVQATLVFTTNDTALLRPSVVGGGGDFQDLGSGNPIKDIKVNAAADGSTTPKSTDKLTLRAQQPGFDGFTLSDVLKSRPATSITQLPDLPQVCKDYHVDTSERPAECPAGNTMTASSVTFADCGSSYTVCRCENSTAMEMSDAVERLGAIPIGLRRYMGTILLMPDAEPHAYTLTTGDIHIFQDLKLEGWIHEAGHALDYANSDKPFSNSTTPILSSRSLPASSQRLHARDFKSLHRRQNSGDVGGWMSALAADTCVPDTYSQTNAIEDFAQWIVLKVYALTHDGELPPGFDASCMKNQLAFIDSLPQLNAKLLFGNTCDYDTSGQRGGIQTSGGVKHQQPPSPLDPSLASPYKNSKTVTSTNAVVGNTGADPYKKNDSASVSIRALPSSSKMVGFGFGMLGVVLGLVML